MSKRTPTREPSSPNPLPAPAETDGSPLLDSVTVQACCRALRLGRQAEASRMFDHLLEQLQTTITALPALRAAALEACLLRSLQSQAGNDSIGLADELEFVLLPLLDNVKA